MKLKALVSILQSKQWALSEGTRLGHWVTDFTLQRRCTSTPTLSEMACSGYHNMHACKMLGSKCWVLGSFPRGYVYGVYFALHATMPPTTNGHGKAAWSCFNLHNSCIVCSFMPTGTPQGCATDTLTETSWLHNQSLPCVVPTPTAATSKALQ